MKSIHEWINDPEIKKIKNQPIRKLLADSINRDPHRTIYYDNNVFYSPADGIILYSNIVKPDEQVIYVKGEDYTIKNLLFNDEIKDTCLVIGIFMTCLDVHINRMPTDGYLSYKPYDSLKTLNLSMRKIESQILEEMGIQPEYLNYAIYNERVINRIYCNFIKQHYWIVQIADFEVDVIAHFENTDQFYNQGERFSLVRLGSQVDLIIPIINKKINFEFTGKVNHHVESGIDKIVYIDRKGMIK